MSILFISLDKNLLIAGSESWQRHKEYGQLFKELHILVLGEGEKQKIGDNIFIHPINKKNKLFKIFAVFSKAKKIINRHQVNLISAQDPFFTGFIGWLIKIKFKIPLQLQIHTDFLSRYFWRESFLNKLRVWLAKFLLPKADYIRVVSLRIKNSLINKNYRLKTNPFILPIFVDIERIIQAPIRTDLHKKYPQFDFIILMVSRLTTEKNISLAIEALIEILKKYPKFGLIIVGGGSQEQDLRLQVADHKLETSIIFEPWIEDPISYYKTADLFLLTSNYEGFARTPIEAMAAGCPVIMTDVGIAGEIIKDKENGQVVPVGNLESLIRSIFEIIEDNDYREKIINNASQAVQGFAAKRKYLEEYKKSLSL